MMKRNSDRLHRRISRKPHWQDTAPAPAPAEESRGELVRRIYHASTSAWRVAAIPDPVDKHYAADHRPAIISNWRADCPAWCEGHGEADSSEPVMHMSAHRAISGVDGSCRCGPDECDGVIGVTLLRDDADRRETVIEICHGDRAVLPDLTVADAQRLALHLGALVSAALGEQEVRLLA